jgi:DNA-binding PadR family transcriptional regulator
MPIEKNIQAKLTKGLLDLIILQLLENNPMHGYQIITTIRKNFGVLLGASTVYPLLNTMEKKKYITSEWNTNSDRPRKIYKLTSNGKATLNYTACSLMTICRTIGRDNTQTHNEIQPQIPLIQH